MTTARTQAGSRLLARFIEAGRRWPSTRGYFTPADVIAIESEAAPASLDAAWQEAEAALPEGYTLRLATIDDAAPYIAEAIEVNSLDAVWGDGPTPAAALRALAAKLRKRAG